LPTLRVKLKSKPANKTGKYVFILNFYPKVLKIGVVILAMGPHLYPEKVDRHEN